MATIVYTSAPAASRGGGLSADSLAAAAHAVEGLGACSTDYDALTDAELLAGQRNLARLRGLVETRSVWMAKTLAHRSRPELGQNGLAARQGFTSPDELIQDMTGSTRKDALKLVDVARMLGDAEAAQAHQAEADAEGALRLLEVAGRGLHDSDGSHETGETDWAGGAGGLFDDESFVEHPAALPWHSPISSAVNAGTLSVAAAHAIRTGLGDVDSVVTGRALADAVNTLLGEAKRMNVDQLLRRSRRMRDSLDEAGIATREKKAWDDRYLRVWKSDAGQVHIHGLFPPEQGEFILSVYDSLTGPRRGGVRFVDPDRAAWARAVQDDPRSTGQIAADTFLDLLKAGSEVNPGRMLGGRLPAVRVLVTEPTRRPAGNPDRVGTPAPEGTEVLVPIPDGTGHGFIEGNLAPVSRETIGRLICTSGTVEVALDADGQPLNLGREERIFSQAQRIAMAARDGGCRWGDCDRPPSRTEAHHLEEWVRDHGLTDIRLGILLCGPHHRLLHNQGWQIFENRGRYWLRPPAAVDPGQTLIEMRGKSAAAGEQHAAHGVSTG
ncbi:HNH endonuclease [Cryobacterium lactosi]|uniref:HNH endonuclease n=1 Tax=Cryobacterium lactosi TaxID=1259202 RepID=A0A4R9BU42_9MICO|nr:HNH endonuclease signature motif containing protein [Cryobacterium lactosi]TFD90663.1 HNH endonuclease [Cryobacterium lactosi]